MFRAVAASCQQAVPSNSTHFQMQASCRAPSWSAVSGLLYAIIGTRFTQPAEPDGDVQTL